MDTLEYAIEQFLSAYTKHTLASYRLDMRLYTEWCDQAGVVVLDATRADIERYVHHMQVDRGNGRLSVVRRIATVRRFYEIATEDQLINRNPARLVRTPRANYQPADYDGLTHLEAAALLRTARMGRPDEWVLVVLMLSLGLRVGEAVALQIEDTSYTKDGHRVVRFIGKGNKKAVVPLPVPVARAVDAAIGERTNGFLAVRPGNLPHNEVSARRAVKRIARAAEIEKRVFPHLLRHTFITTCLDAGVSLRDAAWAARHSDSRMVARYDRNRGKLDRHAAYIVAAFMAGSN